MKKYNRKVWLDRKSHSTSNIVCFYDQKCLNDELALNVSISDCENRAYFINGSVFKDNPKKAIPKLVKLLNIFKRIYSTIVTNNELSDYSKDLNIVSVFFNDEKRFVKKYWLCKSKSFFKLTYSGSIISLEFNKRSGLKTPGDLSKKTRKQFLYKTIFVLHADKETCDFFTFEKKIKTIINELQNFLTFITS